MKTLELFDLSGKVAIVTGGGVGIGRQMAEGLAELGASLVLCARKPERCEQAAAELAQATGVTALGMRCDVANPEEVQAVVDRTLAELGRIDILVNNAGTVWARRRRTSSSPRGRRSSTSTSRASSSARRRPAAR